MRGTIYIGDSVTDVLAMLSGAAGPARRDRLAGPRRWVTRRADDVGQGAGRLG